MRHTLVLGVGNTLLGDEGIGVHAMRALQSAYDGSPDIEFVDGGTLSFTLSGLIADADALLVLDATQLNAAPGSVQLFNGEDMDRFLGSRRRASVHEVSLLDLLAIAHLSDALPAQRALIGVQPQWVDWAETPTPAVAAAIPQVCALARSLIASWQLERVA